MDVLSYRWADSQPIGRRRASKLAAIVNAVLSFVSFAPSWQRDKFLNHWIFLRYPGGFAGPSRMD